MQHLTAEQLNRYKRGQMKPSELWEADEHIAACELCRSQLLQPAQFQQAAESLIHKLRFDAQRESNCLDYDRVAAYVDDQLDDSERELVELHLQGCPQCAEDVRSLRQFKTVMSAQPVVVYAPEEKTPFWSEWARRLRNALTPRRAWALASAAAVLVLVLLSLRHRANVGTSPVLVKLNDATGQVTLTADGQLSLPGNSMLPPEWARRVKELLTKGTVSQSQQVLLAMAEVQSSAGVRSVEQGETPEPVPLSPVATAVKSTRPVFRWTPVKGAQDYTLIIAKGNQIEVVWEGDVGTQTHFALPTSAPELQPGEVYSWQVEVNGGKSTLWGKFRVLDAAALKEVSRMEQRFAKSPLMLGAVYEAHGLYDDAQKQFERLVKLNPTNPLAQRMRDSLQQRRSKE